MLVTREPLASSSPSPSPSIRGCKNGGGSRLTASPTACCTPKFINSVVYFPSAGETLGKFLHSQLRTRGSGGTYSFGML